MASVARTVKFATVVLFGVPVMAPVLLFKLAQLGSAPLEMLYTYGVAPPAALTVWL